MIEKLHQKAIEILPELLRIRQHIHAHPELSFEEHATMEYVAVELDKIGVKYQKGIATTGLVATIEGKNPQQKCIALRADMDALPIQEENEVSYKSTNNGVMHACGHDVHTACLLGAAKLLFSEKENLEGTIKLLFQPGEEKNPGGASLMIKDGALENPKPAAIFGLHVYPQLPCGSLGFRGGRYMASADELYITIKGKGGHAALPQQTIDPITTAAMVITGLQQIVSRKANPLSPTVLTFGSIEGGKTTNVIPEKVKLMGTLRTFDEQWRQEALALIKTITQNICAAYGAEATIEIPEGYPSLYNDPATTEKARKAAEEYLGAENVHELEMRMGAEDFAFYTHVTKGCFFRLGTNRGNQEFTAPVHNSRFDIDENALAIGAGAMTYIALRALKD
ncbi:MAG: M20 family metallopeptidase [Edaphocola sp.]